MLERIQSNLSAQSWGSLWQQRPYPTGGNMLSRASFEILPEAPPNVAWQRGWDLAFTAKQLSKSNPDYSVGIKGGIWYRAENWATVVLTDMVYERNNWPQIHQLITKTAQSDGREVPIGIGGGGAKASIADLLTDEALMGYYLRSIAETTDKVARAQPWLYRATVGWLAVVQGPWNDFFFQQVESFPNGSHDDVIDAVSVLWEMLFTQPEHEETGVVELEGVDLGYWDR